MYQRNGSPDAKARVWLWLKRSPSANGERKQKWKRREPMPTQNEIYDRTLTRINRLGDGQTATASQVEKMAYNLESLHAYLMHRNYIEYAIDEIPEEDADSFYTLLAQRSELDFSVSFERMQVINAMAESAWQVLFANNQVPDNGEPTPAQYY
jgi:hypothetical protein